ncbi:MAG: DUF5703 domain-containing protein [Planctomycetota bacterium]|nr:DUF5703 domain-containing protein [Planctomycetota bacterium]
MNCTWVIGPIVSALILVSVRFVLAAEGPWAAGSPQPVVWDSPSENSLGSMPLGNGDISVNAWVEPGGDLVFLIGKTDSWDEFGRLLKIGRVRVKLSPALPVKPFVQTLDLRKGEMAVASGAGQDALALRVWVDANHPVIRVELEGAAPRDCTAQVELWRTKDKPHVDDPREHSEGTLNGSGLPLVDLADTVVPAGKGADLAWYHRNTRSIYGKLLESEHLGKALETCPDPLINRTFGAVMTGTGMAPQDDRTLKSTSSAARRVLTIAVLTSQPATAEAWLKDARELSAQARTADLAAARHAHEAWWESFWSRSVVNVTGDAQAMTVTRGYERTRYLLACCSRGPMPPKFNGATFTVDHPGTTPDFRQWGGNYWFQNNRWLTWPLLATGDFDLMDPFFQMYVRMLPLIKQRTQLYYKHEGAYCVETFCFWGTHNANDFHGYGGSGGPWNNATVVPSNPYVTYYWQSGIELVNMMLDRYDYTQDQAFAKATLLPLAEAITTFYEKHYPRDASRKIRFQPAAALETWHTAVNPLPEIAGLRTILPRLLAMNETLTTASQRATWKKTLADLPALPMARRDGKTLLLPAETYASPANSENPELYALFPYRLYGLGKPDFAVARDSFAARANRGAGCWNQSGVQAAIVGNAKEARDYMLACFSASSAPQRFPAFWPPGNDWTPDMDNGGTGMMALQYMLLQGDGGKITLLPAWPKEWNVDFKLHAPAQTVVEASVREGKVVRLNVTPASRAKDVTIAPPFTQGPATAPPGT